MHSIAILVKNHRLYADYHRISTILRSHQFVCWLAGGAVRDFLLGREVHEFDLVTDASTEVLKGLFPDALLVGESFGVLKISYNNKDFFDLTTFREESDYLDGRHPSAVKSSTPTLDSLRRDFTINSLFWDDLNERLWDFQSGVGDLQLGVLRCVGIARSRFSEDYLRIVRLMRFSVQLDFLIEPETLTQALQLVSKIDGVSGERIWTELKKIETSDRWGVAFKNELFQKIVCQLFGDDSLFKNSIEISLTKLSTSRFLAVLFIDRDFSDVLRKRLKISNLELESYRATQYILKNYEKKEPAEWVCEIEKTAKLNEVFLDLSMRDKKIDRVYKLVNELMKEFPVPLISPKEILGLLPAHKISTELREARLKQLGKNFKTKGEVIAYLKKKYANHVANS